MRDCIVELEFLSYWQPGSGLGIESAADSAVVRDGAGLPFLPGRTLKGLLRDACDLAGISEADLRRWFGSSVQHAPADEHPEPHLEASRFTTEEGRLWFDSARLPRAWIDWMETRIQAAGRFAGDAKREAELDAETRAAMLQANKDLEDAVAIRDTLFRFIASTSIDRDGAARDHTLRVMQVVVPMTLRARVRGPDDGDWIDHLKQGSRLLRSIGSRRHRGYGRVRCSIERVQP